MKMTAFLLLFSLTLGGVSAQEEVEEKKQPTFEVLHLALASDDFEKRNAAGQAIWLHGEEALDFLHKLESDSDPELAVRAARIRYKIRCGILPDTPPEIVEILEGYQGADAVAKERIAKQLKEGGHYEYILRLYSLEENEDIKMILRKMVNDSIPNLIQKFIAEDNMSEVGKLLRFANDFDGLIRYASFLQLQGELDEEISRLKEFEDLDSISRYLSCLRVKGDLPLLKKEATRLGDLKLAALAALLMGDPIPLHEERLASGELEVAQQILMKLLIARLKGDQEGESKKAASLVKIATESIDPSERYFARMGLYTAGLTEEAGEVASKGGFNESYEYLVFLDQDEKVPALLGINNFTITNRWLKEQMAALTGELLQENDEGEVMTRLRTVCFFYENRGDYQTVSRLLSGMLDVHRASGKEEIIDLCVYYLSAFPRGSLAAVAREVNKFKLHFGELIQAHGENLGRSSLLWLWNESKEIDPDLTTLETLSLLNAYVGAGTLSFEEFQKWNEILLNKVKEAEPDERYRLAARLQNLWAGFGPASAIHELFEIPEYGEKRFVASSWYASRLGRYEEALALLESADPESYLNTSGSILYRKGLLLQKNGQPEAAEETFMKAQLYGGGVSNFCFFNARYQNSYGQEEECYNELVKCILRSSKEFRYLPNAMRLLLDRAVSLKKWKQASALAGSYHLYDETQNSGGLLLKAYEYHYTHGLALLEEGKKDEAIAVLEKSHAMIPASGSLADYFFPALREYGLDALHDRLCQETLALMRRKIEVFPTDHSAKNTFAWIASRANRNLSEAEEMITLALKDDPLSPALMDTYAEVKFAQGDRKTAVEWSKRAVEYDIEDDAIRGQLRRFKSGAFPQP